MNIIRRPLVALLLPPLITTLLTSGYWLLLHQGAEAALEQNIEAVKEPVRQIDQQLHTMKKLERLLAMRRAKTEIRDILQMRRSHDRMPERLMSLAQKYGVELQGFNRYRNTPASNTNGISHNYTLYFQAPKSVHFYRLIEGLERESDFTTVRLPPEGEWAPRSLAEHTLAVSLQQVTRFEEEAQ